MSTTFGQLLFRASKLPNGTGVDPELLKGYANDRYKRIINHYPWSRILQIDTILQTVVEYATGTLDATLASTTLSGTDTVWTTAMTGRRIRIAGRSEWYTFTRVSGTAGTLDRAYEGDTDTLLTYSIWQPVYALPTDTDVVESLKLFSQNSDLDQVTQEELDKIDPARLQVGNPVTYAPYEDDSTTPPLPQVELWPGPDSAVGMPLRYLARIDAITATSTIFPQWIPQECLFSGLQADLAGLAGDYTGKQVFEVDFQSHLQALVRKETNREPAEQMRTSERWIEHRRSRASGDDLLRLNRLRQMP